MAVNQTNAANIGNFIRSFWPGSATRVLQVSPNSITNANREQMDAGIDESILPNNHSQVASLSSNMDADGRDAAIVGHLRLATRISTKTCVPGSPPL